MLAFTLLFISDAARPTLRFEAPALQAKLGTAFDDALTNVLDVNAVPCDPKTYDRSGLMTGTRFLRAGGGYAQPWTRDAAINGWNAASLLSPEVARDTLWSVTKPDANGEPTVQRDNQWWDKVVWIVGAWNHYLVTGDRGFLVAAYGTAGRLLREMRAGRYEPRLALFQGPSFFNDGIAGYPAPPAAADDGGGSFVLDHPGADRIMALSTNCLYVGAYRAAASMAREIGRPDVEWRTAAEALRASINRGFWMPKRGMYGYLLDGDGRLDPSEEGCGLAFAVLFDVADPPRARLIVRRAHVEPFGMTDVYPSFARYSDDRPGRHNAIVWPMVQGMWARAATKARDAEALGRQAEALAGMEQAAGGHFFEIYGARTGKPDGGWQNGRHWGSEPDQTWSATAYLSMITNGLFGMRFEPKGLRFEPLVPKGWGDATLSGLRYRKATLTIVLRGRGSKARTIRLDGKPVSLVSADLAGRHTVEIDLR